MRCFLDAPVLKTSSPSGGTLERRLSLQKHTGESARFGKMLVLQAGEVDFYIDVVACSCNHSTGEVDRWIAGAHCTASLGS